MNKFKKIVALAITIFMGYNFSLVRGFDGKIATASINEVIKKFDDKKYEPTVYNKIRDTYIEIKNVYKIFVMDMLSYKEEKRIRKLGFDGMPYSCKPGNVYSAIGLNYDPNERHEIKTIVPIVREKLISTIKSFTQNVISRHPELATIEQPIKKFIQSIED